MRKIEDISKYQYLGIYNHYTYALKTLSMGRALVAVKMINGRGFNPLKREGKSKPYIAFSKIDCRKEKAILEYANKYGVPFNLNQVYPLIKNPAEAASRAAGKTTSHEVSTINFGELLRPYEMDLKESVWEETGLELYRKTAAGSARALVYPLDDFWYEVDQMRRVLEWQGVVQGSLPNSERAPGAALSAEYLKTAINHEIAGAKVSTFLGYRDGDKLGNYPEISRQYIPIDFKQALYSALIDDLDAGVPVGRCEYRRCRAFFIVDRKGKVFCSEACRNNSNRMRTYHRKKESLNHGTTTRKR